MRHQTNYESSANCTKQETGLTECTQNTVTAEGRLSSSLNSLNSQSFNTQINCVMKYGTDNDSRGRSSPFKQDGVSSSEDESSDVENQPRGSKPLQSSSLTMSLLSDRVLFLFCFFLILCFNMIR